MNLRWLLFDYVDPELKLTPAERNSVCMRTMIAGRHREHIDVPNRLLFITAMVPAVGMLLGFGAMFYLLLEQRAPWYACIIVCFVVQIISTWLLLAIVGRKSFRAIVCSELRLLGHEVCPECSYWLHELPGNVKRCPECGAERLPMPEHTS